MEFRDWRLSILFGEIIFGILFGFQNAPEQINDTIDDNDCGLQSSVGFAVVIWGECGLTLLLMNNTEMDMDIYAQPLRTMVLTVLVAIRQLCEICPLWMIIYNTEQKARSLEARAMFAP